MKGGVYSACGAMKEIVPSRSPGQWSHSKRYPVADMHAHEFRLGDEEAHEDVLGRQQRDDGRARRERFSRERDDVRDDPG